MTQVGVAHLTVWFLLFMTIVRVLPGAGSSGGSRAAATAAKKAASDVPAALSLAGQL